MLKRRKVSHPGASMEGKSMYFASLEPRGTDHAYQHGAQANYRMEIPERKHSRKGKIGTKFMRVRLIFPRLRIRFLSPMNLYEKMRDSYSRLVFTHRRPDSAAVSPLYDYSAPSCSSDAIAECIEFVKRNAAAQENVLLNSSPSRRGKSGLLRSSPSKRGESGLLRSSPSKRGESGLLQSSPSKRGEAVLLSSSPSKRGNSGLSHSSPK